MQKSLFKGSKKGFIGSLNLLPSVMISLALFVLIGAIVAGIVADQRDSYVTNTAGCNSTDKSDCGYDYNITVEGLDGMDNVSSQTPTIGTTVVAGVLIAIVIGAFGFVAARRS